MPKTSKTETDRHVGRRVRMRRNELGMSQERLAELLGITFQQVQKYELGVNSLNVNRLRAIAAALQVEPAYFLDGAPALPGVVAAPPIVPEQDLVQRFMGDRRRVDLAQAVMTLDDNELVARITRVVECVVNDRRAKAGA